MLKENLRTVYKRRRKLLSQEELSNASSAIADILFGLPIWHFENFHIYLSITAQKEIDTSHIISILQGRKKNVIVPKIVGSNSLSHYLLTDTTQIGLNALQIPEPSRGVKIISNEIDVVFVPLLAFDKLGNRVGYGRGFYDRFLSECKSDILKIGLSLFEAEENIEDIDEHDVPLDYCITPNKIYCFSDSDLAT